jgi:hypothetical protein
MNTFPMFVIFAFLLVRTNAQETIGLQTFSLPFASIWFRHLEENRDFVRFSHGESDYELFLGARSSSDVPVNVSNVNLYESKMVNREFTRTLVRSKDTNRAIGYFSWMNVINRETTGPELHIDSALECRLKQADWGFETRGPMLHIRCVLKENASVEHNFYVQRLSASCRRCHPLVGSVSLTRPNCMNGAFLKGCVRLEGDEDYVFILRHK